MMLQETLSFTRSAYASKKIDPFEGFLAPSRKVIMTNVLVYRFYLSISLSLSLSLSLPICEQYSTSHSQSWRAVHALTQSAVGERK